MASLMTVRLDKGNSPNLGFRLQGGKDFGTALVVQKVNGGSPAERAGLLAGDSVIKINNTDVFNLRHKDAQDVIIRAGPSFEVTVQRGGSVWKPSVIPTGPVHSTTSTVTKTSLAANKKENIDSIGTGHNLSAKPFSPQLNGTVNGVPKVVNNQYNSPLKLYSEESIAETLSAQTEVLSTGVLGVNFKKNEKSYDATNSAVFRMLKEAENEPKTPEAEPETTVTPSAITGLRHVTAPENRPVSEKPQLPPGQNICADCERLIVGVFVRIKDKNLHVECFKCSTCGTSLKNVGYYNINNKLYCDVHAKLAARSNPPAPNLVPVTVSPGSTKAPVSAISSALASHSLPSPSSLSPRTNLAQPYQAGNYSTTPKPFSSVSAPSQTYNTLPRSAPAPAPLSPIASAPAPFSPASSADRSVHSFVWPPQPEEPEAPTACPLYVAPSTHLKVIPKTIQYQALDDSDTTSDSDFEIENINIMSQPKLSLCSEEVCQITGTKSVVDCIETISEKLETQKLVENVLKSRPKSPPPVDVSTLVNKTKSDEVSANLCSIKECHTESCQSQNTCELKRLTEFKPNTVSCQLQSQVDNAVPKKWESQMVQALQTVPDTRLTAADPFGQIPKKSSSSALASALAIAPSEPFTAQPHPYLEPVPLPEETIPYFPPEHSIEIEPKEPKPVKPDSHFVKALQTAPERPFTPVGGTAPVKKKKDPLDEFLKDLPKPQARLTMRDALCTASDRPYSPFTTDSVKSDTSTSNTNTEKIDKKNLQKPLKPSVLPPSFQKPISEEKPRAPKPFPVMIHEKQEEEVDVKSSSSKIIEKHKTESTVEESVENFEDQSQGMYPLFKGFSCSFGNKSEHSQFTIEVSTTPPIIYDRSHTPNVKISKTGQSTESVKETITEEAKIHEKSLQEMTTIAKQAEQVVLKKPIPLVSNLHKPDKLPQYQVNISENAEADLQLMQKIEVAKQRQQQHQQRQQQYAQKQQQQQQQQQQTIEVPSPASKEIQIKPIITVQPGETCLHPHQSFKPVTDEPSPSSNLIKPPALHPRPVTPSMIQKAPSVIPYYQANLVAQQYRAPEVNLLDPASPAVSRSPSPYPDQRRSPSPFPTKGASALSTVRPKSPAAGPPPNPLRSEKSVPTPRDSQVEVARQNLSTYIPQHKNTMESRGPVRPQIYNAQVTAHNISEQEMQQCVVSNKHCLQVDSGSRCMMTQDRKVEDSEKMQLLSEQTANAQVSTAILEKLHQDHLEQTKKSQSQMVECSADGTVQVQRKKMVMEEFEHTQKAKVIQIEKNVSSTNTYPFKDVRNPVIEQPGIVGLHVTNPQPIVSPFFKANASQSGSQPLPQPQCQVKQPPKPQLQHEPLQQGQTSLIPKPSVKHVIAPSLTSPIRHVPAPPFRRASAPSGSARKPGQNVNRSNIPVPNTGAGSGSGGRQAGAIGVAPKRGRGVLNTAALAGTRIALCASCHTQIRGPFITALGKIWCPDHFICATPSCRRPLQDLGFVEEQGQLYCEYCFEQYLAPPCAKCSTKVKGDCLKAIGKNFHPECFACFYCGKLFGNSPFFLEDGNPYCETDWNELFTTKCFACGFPVEAGDRWVEALNNNYHSQCFNCTMCKKNLEGQSFFAKGGRPFCKNHAR